MLCSYVLIIIIRNSVIQLNLPEGKRTVLERCGFSWILALWNSSLAIHFCESVHGDKRLTFSRKSNTFCVYVCYCGIKLFKICTAVNPYAFDFTMNEMCEESFKRADSKDSMMSVIEKPERWRARGHSHTWNTWAHKPYKEKKKRFVVIFLTSVTLLTSRHTWSGFMCSQMKMKIQKEWQVSYIEPFKNIKPSYRNYSQGLWR